MPSKLALITGASKGIGRAVAQSLAKEDLRLLITGRDEHDLQTLKAEIEEQKGSCEYVVADLSRDDAAEKLIHEIKANEKFIHLIVHSAGIAKVGKIAEIPLEDWRINLTVNLTAPFYLTQKCLPFMAHGSAIIFINSVAGKKDFPEWSAYCAAKAGLAAFAETLRQEVQEQGIKVISIFPASVDTPMQDKLPYNWDRSKMLTAEQVAEIVKIAYCQPDNVLLKSIELESITGIF